MTLGREMFGFKPSAARIAIFTAGLFAVWALFAVVLIAWDSEPLWLQAVIVIAYLVSGLAVIELLRNRFFIEDFQRQQEPAETREIDR
ncbi:MAG: hypothetical protein U9P68_11375 [Pseudomonadota bacterium]|nr:hypothetical protein [Pseudomonadota bacterium]